MFRIVLQYSGDVNPSSKVILEHSFIIFFGGGGGGGVASN